MSDVNANQLAKVSKLFEALDDGGRHKLLAMARRTKHPDGFEVCKEGDSGDEFFVLVSGRVRVSAELNTPPLISAAQSPAVIELRTGR